MSNPPIEPTSTQDAAVEAVGSGPDGTYRRRWERFSGTAEQADTRLALLTESVRLPDRFWDMRVRELVDRYLTLGRRRPAHAGHETLAGPR